MLRHLATAGLALWLVSGSAQQPGDIAEPCVALWVDASGRPTGDARDALALLEGAAADGLDPFDYAAAPLAAAAAALARVDVPRPAAAAAFDAQLTASTLRYLRHLRFGRLDPALVGVRMPARADEDLFVPLRAAVAAHRVRGLAVELAPPMALYAQLREALGRYRRLAADPMLQGFRPPRETVHPGERCADLGSLSIYLSALGDLPSGAAALPGTLIYDGALVEAVKHFQARHGLEPDGVFGPATRAALSVPLSWRERQIALSLERLRWLPEFGRERILTVNIPMFRLWGLEGEPSSRTVSFSTAVIVGRALNTRTPVLVEQMESIIFRPYWNVPASILRHEILPALSRDPDYLRRHNMERVSAGGATRIRQRPGPGNSLGLVKFVFPNDANVYMHGTPVPELFSRARRDFSHGCVRVADPVGLAEWVLAGQSEWTRERIVAAMEGSATFEVPLARKIPVILFYTTAIIVPEDGVLLFADDIYGHDARLDRYLNARAAARAGS